MELKSFRSTSGASMWAAESESKAGTSKGSQIWPRCDSRILFHARSLFFAGLLGGEALALPPLCRCCSWGCSCCGEVCDRPPFHERGDKFCVGGTGDPIDWGACAFAFGELCDWGCAWDGVDDADADTACFDWLRNVKEDIKNDDEAISPMSPLLCYSMQTRSGAHWPTRAETTHLSWHRWRSQFLWSWRPYSIFYISKQRMISFIVYVSYVWYLDSDTFDRLTQELHRTHQNKWDRATRMSAPIWHTLRFWWFELSDFMTNIFQSLFQSI